MELLSHFPTSKGVRVLYMAGYHRALHIKWALHKKLHEKLILSKSYGLAPGTNIKLITDRIFFFVKMKCSEFCQWLKFHYHAIVNSLSNLKMTSSLT